jgi:hypothetical protein
MVSADEITTSWLSAESSRWAALLARARHDFYQLPGYGDLYADPDRGEVACAYHARLGEEQLLVPLILRPIPRQEEEWWDAASPYGYPSLLYLAPEDDQPSHLDQLLVRMRADFAARRIVAVFLRLHPLLTAAESALPGHGTLVRHGYTVSVDLTLDEEEMWRQTRRDHRRNINRSKREGHIARMDTQWQHFDAFCAVYRETMNRVGATEQYFFSRSYFEGLRRLLGSRLHLCVVEIAGEIASAGLFTEVCGIVQFHLSGTFDDYLSDRPSKLMLDYVRQWGKARGNRDFHLGGGVGGGNDSLFRFKAGFSDRRHPFHTFRMVPLSGVYRRLCEACEPSADSDDLGGFFPGYRRPEQG